MAPRFKVALIQVNAGNEIAPNIAFIEQQTRAAHAAGAELVMTPENSTMMGADRADTLAKALPENEHPGLASARALARELHLWFLIGSIHIRLPERCANRSFLIDPRGEVIATYDKLHMFDVQLPGGEIYRESASFQPGDRAVLAQTPWGMLGMTICYDMRFPALYTALAQAGATLLSVPSAFTVPTGRAHWHVLLRARAIETSCFVFAPAQVGEHANGRKTYGHSLIVSPWGEVLADAGDQPGFVIADIDLAKVDEARSALPTLRHHRPFDGPAR
jgi:predicted amidohydrolase